MHRHIVMYINIKLSKDTVNLTTTTITNGYGTDSTQPPKDYDLKSILSYAIPFSCLTIFMVLLLIFGIRQRHRVLDRWTSVKRMRNTNPRFLQSTVLRRDSEFDSYNQEHVKSTVRNQEYSKEPQYHLATIS